MADYAIASFSTAAGRSSLLAWRQAAFDIGRVAMKSVEQSRSLLRSGEPSPAYSRALICLTVGGFVIDPATSVVVTCSLQVVAIISLDDRRRSGLVAQAWTQSRRPGGH
jgi:hypothetical protein